MTLSKQAPENQDLAIVGVLAIGNRGKAKRSKTTPATTGTSTHIARTDVTPCDATTEDGLPDAPSRSNGSKGRSVVDLAITDGNVSGEHPAAP
jgi:hypothetical protein